MVISPESIFLNNVVDKLYLSCLRGNNIFTVGNIIFTSDLNYKNLDIKSLTNLDNNNNYLNRKDKINGCVGPVYYGSICVLKSDIEKVGYYNEKFVLWGGEDDDIRKLLENNNIKCEFIKSSNMIHLESHKDYIKRLSYSQNKKNIKNFFSYYSINDIIDFLKDNNIKIPDDLLIAKDVIIKDNNKLTNLLLKNNNKLFKNFLNLNKFDQFFFVPEISKDFSDYHSNEHKLKTLILNSDKNIQECYFGKKFKSKYKIMMLTPCYNEENNINIFLKKNKKFIDGCILLDDSSTDNTWNVIKPKHFSVKVRKKRGQVWNDLENRNILLNILNILLKTGVDIEYVLWLDCDEFIGNIKLNKLKKLFRSEGEVFKLPFYHMWSDTHYNIEYPNKIS